MNLEEVVMVARGEHDDVGSLLESVGGFAGSVDKLGGEEAKGQVSAGDAVVGERAGLTVKRLGSWRAG